MMTIDKQKLSDLQILLDPVMGYLRDNFHPHTSISIDSESSEILEGQEMLLRTDPNLDLSNFNANEFLYQTSRKQLEREQERIGKIAAALKKKGLRLRDIFTAEDDIEHIEDCVYRFRDVAESNASDDLPPASGGPVNRVRSLKIVSDRLEALLYEAQLHVPSYDGTGNCIRTRIQEALGHSPVQHSVKPKNTDDELVEAMCAAFYGSDINNKKAEWPTTHEGIKEICRHGMCAALTVVRKEES